MPVMKMMRRMVMMLAMVLIDGNSKEGGVSDCDHEDNGVNLPG